MSLCAIGVVLSLARVQMAPNLRPRKLLRSAPEGRAARNPARKRKQHLMKTESLSVVLAGGGTAGHISPLLAIAAAIREARPGRAAARRGNAQRAWRPGWFRPPGVELATIDRVPFPRRPSAGPAAAARPARRCGQAGRAHPGRRRGGRPGGRGRLRLHAACTSPPGGGRSPSSSTRPTPGPASPTGWVPGFSRHVAVAFAGTPLRHARHVGMPMRREISGLDRAARPGRCP